jgi:predicted HTH domain antitoxin
MTKTMSIRMDRDNYEFLNEIRKEQRSDLSKAVRDLVSRGRVLLAVERYRNGEASLGKAAEIAGVPVGQMMTILSGIRCRKTGRERGLSARAAESGQRVVELVH